MNDLIDRQAAIDECYPVTVDGEVYEVVQVETLMGLPSAQPEVVRCKDCIHRPVMVWSEVYDDFDVLAPEVDGKEDWRCPCLVEDDPYYSWSPNDNWFCGNGERRVTDGVCK